MKYPAKNPAKNLAKNPAKFLKPEPDIEAGYPAGSGFSRISGRFLGGMITFEYLIDPTQKYSQNNCGIWMYSITIVPKCIKNFSKMTLNF